MFETLTIKDDPRLARIARALGYRKRHARVAFVPSLTPSGQYWDGGSRTWYALFNWESGNPLSSTVPNEGRFPCFRESEFQIPPGACVAATGVFRGKAATLCLYVNLSSGESDHD